MKYSCKHFLWSAILMIVIQALVWLALAPGDERAVALAQSVEVCGTLAGDTVWDDANGGIYTVTCPVIVPAGVVLTVQAGVRVEFNSGNNYLLVHGGLLVNGTADAPVLFTSSQVNPYAGIWDRIGFEPGSTGNLNYAIVEYGGHSTYASLQIEGGFVSVQNSIIRYSSQQGMRTKVWPNLIDNQFVGNAGEAMLLNSSASQAYSAVIRGNTGSGNGQDAFLLDGYIPGDLTLGKNPGLAYVVEGTIEASSGTILTIEAGARFEMGLDGQVSGAMDIGGTLLVQGTEQDPVVFTSVGAANAQGAAGDWWRIYLMSGSNATIEYAQVNCGGAATGSIYAEDASLTLEGVAVSASGGEGIYVRNSHLRIANSTIHDNQGNGLAYVLDTPAFTPDLEITNNRFTHNGQRAVYLRLLPESGTTFSAAGNTGWGNSINGIMLDARLNDTTLAANPGLPYVVESLTINPNNTLWVEAGTVFKSSIFTTPGGTLIDVDGSLVTMGTSTSPVVFTSIFDCAYGGATTGGCPMFLPMMVKTHSRILGDVVFRPSAGSSFAYHPHAGDWRGIIVQAGGSVDLEHTIVQYAGYPDVGQITILGGSAEMDYVTARFGLNHGVFAEDASITVRNSNLSENLKNGLRIFGNTIKIEPVIQDSTFNWNGNYAVYLILNGGGLGNGVLSGNTGQGNGLVNGIYLEGYITDRTSRLASNPDFPYVIWTITVNSGAKLTIDPGTVLKFTSPPDAVGFSRGTGSAIIEGEVEAVGGLSAPIIFTSYWDDTAGGDTNGDHLGANVLPGDWLGFIVRSSGQANLDYTEFRYGGNDGWNVWADGGTIDMAHSLVSHSAANGIGGSGMLTLTYSEIRYNQGNGVHLNGPASVEWCYISDNGGYGLVNYYNTGQPPGYRVPATNNYWGSASGPSYDGGPCPFDPPSGNGALINCRVEWYPYLSAPPQK